MIYLDYNASTPTDPLVADAMIPFLKEIHGNPSSAHGPGRRIRTAIESAREQMARLIGASATEIVFLSGGTEASNHVIKGVAHSRRQSGRHMIISAIEHPATSAPCRFLAENGFEISVVGVDEYGMVDPAHVAHEVRPDTILISIMHANNEVGTIQPIREIAEIAREGKILLHTDAAQSCGKIPVDVRELGVDFASIAGHKFCGPQGVGALYIRDGIEIAALHHGAGHEGGRRAGTEAVPAVIGLGLAAELAANDLKNPVIRQSRDLLYEGLQKELGDNAMLLGHPVARLPNTLAMGFRACIGADVLSNCPEVCASTGAACHAADRKRSAVLAAMNVPEAYAFGAIRFSTGRFTTADEIEKAIPVIVDAVRRCSASVRA